MSPEDKASYKKIVVELRTFSARLNSLSEAGYADMEGADMPEFSISEELYCLDGIADSIEKTCGRIEKLLDPTSSTDDVDRADFSRQ